MRIRMNRTGKRYQRAIFWWILSLVVNNTFRVFEHLVPAFASIMRERGLPWNVYRRVCLSRVLIAEGVRLHRMQYGDAAPHWMPRQREPQPKPIPPVSAIPEDHHHVPIKDIVVHPRARGSAAVYLAKERCAQCLVDATAWSAPDDGGKRRRVKPEDHPSPNKGVRQNAMGCSACQVQLCEQCFTCRWNHNTSRHGNVHGRDVVFRTHFGETRVLGCTGTTRTLVEAFGGGSGGSGGGGGGSGSGGGGLVFSSPAPQQLAPGQVAVTPRPSAGAGLRQNYGRARGSGGHGQVQRGQGRGQTGGGRGRGAQEEEEEESEPPQQPEPPVPAKRRR
ncbi:hypothetical protein T492DRAFT_838691 [Pavlovales sp. CCMP2436]|nr:hypothetical protein T492DRAFT_838691 [Pavlovales sp. CCMP2436]